MKNKKKSLNPNKFWYYSGYLPTTNSVNWNYSQIYKTTNQITLFMENLMTRNFNLLLKRVKKFIFNYRKYYAINLFTQIYFVFLKLLIIKYRNDFSLLKYLLFYLKFFKKFILIKKMNIRSKKAMLFKRRKKKRIKEHYLRAVPRYFKDFFFIKKTNMSFINFDYYNIYCYSSLAVNKLYHKKKRKKIQFMALIDYYYHQLGIKNPLLINFFLKNTFLDKKYVLLCKSCVGAYKWKSFFVILTKWRQQKISLLFVYLLKKLTKKQICYIFYFYLRYMYKMVAIRNKKKWFFLRQHKKLKIKYKNYADYSLVVQSVLYKKIKTQQLKFWRLYKRRREKAYGKFFLVCVFLFITNTRFLKKRGVMNYFFFRYIFKAMKYWDIYNQQLRKIFIMQKYIKYYYTIRRLQQRLRRITNSKVIEKIRSYQNKRFYGFLMERLQNVFYDITNYNNKPMRFFVLRQQQLRILQILYIQKYLEGFFSKQLQNSIFFKFINLFFLQNRVNRYRKLLIKPRRLNKKKKFFFEGIKAFLNAYYLNEPLLLSKHIAYRLQQTGRRQKHSKTINEIFYLLKLMKTIGFDLSGFQLLLCGKINANTQTQVKYYKWGPDLRTNTFSYPLQYYQTYAVTYTGVFGIHIWFVKH
jgi:hypothetical protein